MPDPTVGRQLPSSTGPMVYWNRTQQLRGGFLYEQGILVVPRTGRYRVYFQLTYYRGQEECSDSTPLMLIQNLIWVQEGHPTHETLLKVQDTVPCDLKFFRKTLQASAAFDLEVGDKLYVQTNYPGLLSSKGYLGADLEPETWRPGAGDLGI